MSFSFWWNRLDFVWRPKRDEDLCFLDYGLSKKKIPFLHETSNLTHLWIQEMGHMLERKGVLPPDSLYNPVQGRPPCPGILIVLSELSATTLLPWLVPFPLGGNACHFPYLYRVFLPRSCSDGKTTSSLWPQYIFLQMNSSPRRCPALPNFSKAAAIILRTLCLFCQPVWLQLDAWIVFCCVCSTNSEWSLSLDTLRRDLTTSKT